VCHPLLQTGRFGAGLNANGHGLKGVVSAQVVMVGTNSDLALFADMARSGLLCPDGIHPIEIEE
jgi:hypothetical protein